MLTQVLPHQLDAEMIKHYDDAIATDSHSGGVELVSEGIYNGHLELWTWLTNESKMVIITEVKMHPDASKELLVSMLAGNGGIKDWEACTTAFADEVCELRGCDRVIAFVRAELWEIFKAAGVGAGVQEIYMVIGKDPSNGRESDESFREGNE